MVRSGETNFHLNENCHRFNFCCFCYNVIVIMSYLLVLILTKFAYTRPVVPPPSALMDWPNAPLVLSSWAFGKQFDWWGGGGCCNDLPENPNQYGTTYSTGEGFPDFIFTKLRVLRQFFAPA